MSFFGALISDGVLSGAAALFARGNFTDAEKIIINDTFVKLTADDQLQHMHMLKMFGVSSQANALLDWIDATGSIDATVVGTPTFTAYSGFAGTGTNTDRVHSGFNPFGVLNQNNSIVGGWELSDSTDNGQLFGCQDGANEGILCIPRNTTPARLTRMNSDGNDSTALGGGRAVGYHTLDRKNSTEYTVRLQNVTIALVSKASSAVPNLEMWCLTGNNNGTPGLGTTREIGALFAASGAGDYNLITDALNDAVVRLHALGA